MERPTLTAQAGAEAAGQRQEGALRHMAEAAVHFAAELGTALLTPYSHAAEASVTHAQPDRRAGDKVNPMLVDVSPWVSTEHRT